MSAILTGGHPQLESPLAAATSALLVRRTYRWLFALGAGIMAVSFAAGAGHVLATRRSLPGLAIDPLRQARELLHEGDVRASARQFRIAAAIDPGGLSDMVSGLENRARETAPDSQEVQAARLAKDRSPQGPQSWVDLGGALVRDGRLDEAALSFLRAIQFEPGNAPAHSGLGDVFSAAGRTQDALAAYRQALRLDPARAGTHNSLGTVYATMGDPDRASEHFAAALRLQPGFSQAAENLDRVEHDRAARGAGRKDP